MTDRSATRKPPRRSRLSKTATRRAEILLEQLQKLREASERFGLDPIPNYIPPIDFDSIPRPLREQIQTLLTGRLPYAVIRLNSTPASEQYRIVKSFQTKARARAWLGAEAGYRERNGYRTEISRCRSPGGNRIVVLVCTPPSGSDSPESMWPSFAVVDHAGMAEYDALPPAANE
jgi:hypothetical protein